MIACLEIGAGDVYIFTRASRGLAPIVIPVQPSPKLRPWYIPSLASPISVLYAEAFLRARDAVFVASKVPSTNCSRATLDRGYFKLALKFPLHLRSPCVKLLHAGRSYAAAKLQCKIYPAKRQLYRDIELRAMRPYPSPQPTILVSTRPCVSN